MNDVAVLAAPAGEVLVTGHVVRLPVAGSCDAMKLRRPLLVAVGVSAIACGVAYVRVVEPWFRRWGATDDEVTGTLPVDELVEAGTRTTTRAITVQAPIQEVWPWLVQIGQDRAGFYSYTWLENMVGARMRNALSVHPEWQDRFPGDAVWLASEARFHERGKQVAALVEVPARSGARVACRLGPTSTAVIGQAAHGPSSCSLTVRRRRVSSSGAPAARWVRTCSTVCTSSWSRG